MFNDKIYSQERSISSAYIDSGLKLGIAQAVLMVQDNLTECFNKMNCDGIYYRELLLLFYLYICYYFICIFVSHLSSKDMVCFAYEKCIKNINSSNNSLTLVQLMRLLKD